MLASAQRRKPKMAFHHMVDLKRTPAEKVEAAAPVVANDTPDYPYGLCICLDHDTLDKLDLDADCEVGDTIHLVCFATVKACSQEVINGERRNRIELQITDMACEDEDQEGNEAAEGEGEGEGEGDE